MKKSRDQMNNVAVIEALLFVAGDDGLSLEELAKLTNNTLDVMAARIEELATCYETEETSGLKIIETANTYQIVTKREFADYIKKYAQSPFSQTLSRPLLETLAIVAYKQPITRIEIEEIRGVQVASNLQKLRSRQLVEEVGRLDKPGKPLLYGTTNFFLDYFGINSLEELPSLTEEGGDQEMTDLFFKNFQQSFDDIEQIEEDFD
jgi:segregation and condensation protein B